MKGVVLAGGLGTRLQPCTAVVNKHLLPVGRKPMIYYPLEMLSQAGIEDVLLVIGGKSTAEFPKLLKNGRQFGLRSLYYAYQDGEGGIADALSLAEPFAGDGGLCVVLGDNYLEDPLGGYIERFRQVGSGALVLLKSMPDPQNYGVPEFDGYGRIERIVEKPCNPCTGQAVIGIYFYDSTVFSRIRSCSRSKRGELEITDVNNLYAQEGKLRYAHVKGYWGDAGASFEALAEVSRKVLEFEKELEEIEL